MLQGLISLGGGGALTHLKDKVAGTMWPRVYEHSVLYLEGLKWN